MSPKDFGCFFCNNYSSDPNAICSSCQLPINIMDELLKLRIENYNVVDVIGRGCYGWTLKVKDQYQLFAMKIIPRHRLKNDALPDREAQALVACSPHRNIARFWRQINTNISLHNQTIDVFCLIFDFIDNARPLSQIISDNHLRLMKGDVVDILSGIASGLARMHSRGLWHDDLHDDNVIIRTVEPDENLSERFEAKLIDFGSSKSLRLDEPEHSDRSDYMYLAKHILNLTLRFEIGNQDSLAPTDRAFVSNLRQMGHRLSDVDISRRDLSPTGVMEGIRRAINESTTGHDFPSFEEMKKQVHISLSEPLANTNALNLKPQDIALLFRDTLRWTSRLEKSEPVFVIGPRGCGKTMLLRYLSIKSQARPLKSEETPEEVARRIQQNTYIGFLVSAGELRTPFIRSAFKKLKDADESLAEDFCREFINAQFVFEVVRTIIWLSTEKLMSINNDEVTLLCSIVSELINEKKNDKHSLEMLADKIDKRVMFLSSLPKPEEFEPTNLCRDDVLIRLAEGLNTISWTSPKEIWFLLDDYSVTVLPPIAQRAYNPVLFRLSSQVRIKISSEGEGPMLEDILARKYREGREFTKVNLGEVYFQSKEKESRIFFEQILDARFKETGKGSLDDLKVILGEHLHEEGFGKYINSHTRIGDARFHGFGLLCRLCSGDVSFIIELLHLIVNGHIYGDKKQLSDTDQDTVIKRFAHRQLADLRSTAEYGPRLYEFAENLGKLIKEYLANSKGKTYTDERLRIEIEGSGELCEKAQQMHAELLRHSVLISGGAGKSKQGLPTRKLYFRRLFAPCFPFSPSRKGCIALTVKEFETWLLDPSNIAKKMPQGTTIPLFGEE